MSGVELLLLDLHAKHFCVSFHSTFYIFLNFSLHHNVSIFRAFTLDGTLSHASVHTLFITYIIPGLFVSMVVLIKLHGIKFLLCYKQLSDSKEISCYQFTSAG